MTNAQKIRLRLSQVRQRLNEIAGLEGDTFTDEIRAEAGTLQTEYTDLETRHQAAIVAEGEGETRANGEDPDAEARERLELRGRASLTAYLRAALSGRQVDGAEAELRGAAEIGDGIPLELWDTANGDRETRADTATGAPGTVGVNLDRIRPAVFAASIAPRLGIEMPRVASGTYASATITTSLTAAAKAAGGAGRGERRRLHRHFRDSQADLGSARDPCGGRGGGRGRELRRLPGDVRGRRGWTLGGHYQGRGDRMRSGHLSALR